MTSKHGKICSVLAIREIQIKSIMAYYFTCIKIHARTHTETETERQRERDRETERENEYQMFIKMQRRETSEGRRVEMKWDTVILQIGVIGSYKTKHTITIQSSNFTLGHSYQRNENLYPHKNLYANVHSSFSHNSQSLETIQISFNRQMVTPARVPQAMVWSSAIKKMDNLDGSLWTWEDF